MTHTPGPWTLRDDRLSPQVWVEAVAGATRIVRFGSRENWDAIDHGNAHLIAAAPDLLDALEADELFHDHIGHCDHCDTGDCKVGLELGLKARGARRDAIAKARGRPKKES